VYKANLKVRGAELTVHFEVNTLGGNPGCRKCDLSNQAGIVTITDIIQNGVGIEPDGPVWIGVQSRLDKLFGHDLCADHLDEVANRRNIALD
jgi:hypothetical protein